MPSVQCFLLLQVSDGWLDVIFFNGNAEAMKIAVHLPIFLINLLIL